MRIPVTWALAIVLLMLPAAAPTQTIDRHSEPSIACNPDGGFVVVWHSRGQDGDGYGVLRRRFAADGTGGSEGLVNTYTTDDQRKATVCSDSQSNFVIAWESYGQDGDGYGIFAQAFDSLGVPRSDAFQVSTASLGSQEEPAIDCSDDGGFVVVWSAGGTADEDYGILGRRFASNGSSPQGDFAVNTYTSTSQIAPSVATLPNGGFVVVWTSYDGQDGAAYGVFGQRFSSTGAKDGTEFLVNTYTGNSQLAPAVAADDGGRFVVAWSSAQNVDGGYDVFGQRFASSGERDGGELPVNSSIAGDQGASFGTGRVLDVAATGGDGFVVVWQSLSLTGPAPDGDGIGVFAQRFAGVPPAPVGTEFQVNTVTVGDQGYPTVCATTVGEMVIAWESRGGEIDGIFAQRYDSGGAPLGSEIRVSTDTARPYSQCPGDCNQTNSVTVDELVRGVNIALARAALDTCPVFDADDSTTVTVNELVLAVRAALEGCEALGSPTPRPTSTPLSEFQTRHRGKPPVTPQGTRHAQPW